MDDSSSQVLAHIEEDGLLTATIETTHEKFVVEPIWRHMLDRDSSHDMIVYKSSDLKWNLTLGKLLYLFGYGVWVRKRMLSGF